MLPSHPRIPASALRRIAAGSYEQQISEQASGIIEETARQAGFSSVGASVLATFSDRAVVADSEGRCWSVRYEHDDAGKLRVYGCKPEALVVAQQDISAVADGAVAAYFRGEQDKFKQIAEDLLRALPWDPTLVESRCLLSLTHAFGSSRYWRKVFTERREQVVRYTAGQLPAIEAGRLKAKYETLYSGVLVENDIRGYADVVSSDLDSVRSRYVDLSVSTMVALDSAAAVLERARVTAPDVANLCETFARDLVSDMDFVVELVDRTAPRVASVAGRGRLRDILAENLHSYEVASRFVMEVVARLTRAAH